MINATVTTDAINVLSIVGRVEKGSVAVAVVHATDVKTFLGMILFSGT
jgi:hypothetical protein